MDATASLTASRGDVDLAAIGRLLADPGRCRMLLAVSDGRDLSASALAAEAGVSASTASGHLAQLVGAGLLSVNSSGRYRYFRIADPAVAELLESMSRVAPHQTIRSLRQGTRAHALRLGRSCYDHLAGRLGVALTDACVVRGWLDASADEPGFQLTTAGRRALQSLDIELPKSDAVRGCVDWTERQPHMAGAHGRAVLRTSFANGWLARTSQPRVVTVTEPGRKALSEAFGIEWPPH